MQGEVQIRRLTGIAPGVVPFELVLDTLPYVENIRWTRIVARCLLTKCERIDIFLRSGRTEYLLRSKAVLDADDSLETQTEIYAPGNYKLCARFTVPAVGHECELYAFGVVEPSELT